MPPAAYWLIVLFTAVFGGSVGSFLNVVVYRLPNRLSLISPPSHCPKCKTPIRWFDNVPVFGWLMLGGHCRSCHCWIPIRYPLIEACTAAMFVALALAENPLTAAYPVHLMLLCTLLCAALIEVDGDRPPLSLFIPATIVGIVVPLIWPIDGLTLWADLPAGIVASGVCWLLLRSWRKMQEKSDSDVVTSYAGLLLGLIGTGIVLGWLAVAMIALVVLAAHAMLSLPWHKASRSVVPPSVWLLIAALVWLLANPHPFVSRNL